MESLVKRLEARKQEILEQVDKWGRAEGMRVAQVSSYIAFERWLRGVTGDEDFGKCPRLTGTPETAIDMVRAKIREHREKDRKLLLAMDELREENERLKEENSHWRRMFARRTGETLLRLITEELETE